MSELRLDLGGICLACRTQVAPLAAWLQARYGAFRAAPDTPVHACVTVDGEPARLDWGLPVVTLRGGRVDLAAPGWHASLDSDTGEGHVCAAGSPADLAVDYALRVFCAVLALRQGALLAHAAAVVVQADAHSRESAYLFWGPSGAGKTTVARVSANARAGLVLNDDLVILRRSASDWAAHGTPFWNQLQVGPGRRAAAPVRAVLHLVHAPEPAVLPLSRAEALGRIVGGLPIVMLDAGLAARAFETANCFAQEVPQALLAFRPDAGFWEAIQRWEQATGIRQ